MKMIVKAIRKPEKKSPAMPSTAEIASGTEAEIFSAPACTFSAAPLSPSQESSSDSRNCSTIAGRSWRKSRTDPTIGTKNSRAITVTARAVPSTVTAAATPRDIPVLAIRYRTGYSNTSARKIPTKTIRKVSPIAANAASTPSVAATNSTVRIGRNSSTRRDSPGFSPRVSGLGSVSTVMGGGERSPVWRLSRDLLEAGSVPFQQLCRRCASSPHIHSISCHRYEEHGRGHAHTWQRPENERRTKGRSHG